MRSNALNEFRKYDRERRVCTVKRITSLSVVEMYIADYGLSAHVQMLIILNVGI